MNREEKIEFIKEHLDKHKRNAESKIQDVLTEFKKETGLDITEIFLFDPTGFVMVTVQIKIK